MGEEVKINDYQNGVCSGGGDEDRLSDWEDGLPTLDDLTPLSQALIPIELATAFRISPEPSRSLLEVNRASQTTLSSICGVPNGGSTHYSSNNFKSLNDETTTTTTTTTVTRAREAIVIDIDDTYLTGEGSDSRKNRRITDVGGTEEIDSASAPRNNTYNNENGVEDVSARALKRPRLVWTPQLHKRFVDVVAHLGIKNAVPKTIMQLMNVEGLTRENVASHLQKYRLYLKRMQGLSSEGPSPSDHLFASTPVPQSLHESAGGGRGGAGNANGHMGMSVPMPYPAPQLVQMPVIGMPGHVGPAPGGFHGYESHHHHHHHHHHDQYAMMQHQRDWSGNKFGSVAPYHNHVAPSEK